MGEYPCTCLPAPFDEPCEGCRKNASDRVSGDRVTHDIVAELVKDRDLLSSAPAGIWEDAPSGQTLFGYPIVYSDKVPTGEIRFEPLTKESALRYFGLLPPKETP